LEDFPPSSVVKGFACSHHQLVFDKACAISIWQQPLALSAVLKLLVNTT